MGFLFLKKSILGWGVGERHMAFYLEPRLVLWEGKLRAKCGDIHKTQYYSLQDVEVSLEVLSAAGEPVTLVAHHEDVGSHPADSAALHHAPRRHVHPLTAVRHREEPLDLVQSQPLLTLLRASHALSVRQPVLHK